MSSISLVVRKWRRMLLPRMRLACMRGLAPSMSAVLMLRCRLRGGGGASCAPLSERPGHAGIGRWTIEKSAPMCDSQSGWLGR
eukprot:477104-Prymnesium_polylepis.1